MASWIPRVDGLPRAYWVIWSGTLVNRMGGFVVPFLSLYLTNERRVPLSTVGLLVSLLGCGALGAGPAGGWLADRLGRRATLVLSLVLSAGAMLQLGFARSTGHLAFACLAVGFCADLYRPASSAAVADLVPPEDRARAYGLLYWAINLGFSIAAILGGLLARTGYVWLFVADAATTLVYAAIVWAKLDETRPVRPAAPRTGEAGTDRSPWHNGTFLVFCGLFFLVAIQFQQGLVALPVDMKAHGISESVYGLLIAINGVLIVLAQPFLIRRVGQALPARALALGALLVGLGFGTNGIAGVIPLYALSIVLWTLGEIVSTAVAPTVVAAFAPPDMRGRYQGTFQMAWGGSTLAGPALGSLVLEAAGATALWGSCLVLGVVAAAGLLSLGARLPGGSVSGR